MKLSPIDRDNKKTFVYSWLDDPDQYPDLQSQGDVAKYLRLTEATITNWKNERKNGGLGDYNSDEFLSTRTRRADKALLAACEKGNAQALKIYYQLTKRLVEHPEVDIKIVLNADEHFRIREEAGRRLQDEIGERAGGDRGLLSGIQGVPLLSQEACVDNQQEHSEDS